MWHRNAVSCFIFYSEVLIRDKRKRAGGTKGCWSSWGYAAKAGFIVR